MAATIAAQDWRLQASGTPQRVMIGDPTTSHLLTIGIGTGGTGVFDGVALHRSPHQVPGQQYSRPFVDWTRRRVQSGDPASGFLEWIDGAWAARPGTGGGPSGAMCVYDRTRQRVVAFRSWPEETWEFDGAGWTRVPTAHAPTVVNYSMAFDEAQGRTMLFGGYYGQAG